MSQLAALLAAATLTAATLTAACGVSAGSHTDARPRPDASPPADGGVGVWCKGADCPQGELCCGMVFEGPPKPTFATFCIGTDPSLCDDGITYACDGPEDCPDSQPCCMDADAARCSVTGTCQLYITCHTPADCPSAYCCPSPRGELKTCGYAPCK